MTDNSFDTTTDRTDTKTTSPEQSSTQPETDATPSVSLGSADDDTSNRFGQQLDLGAVAPTNLGSLTDFLPDGSLTDPAGGPDSPLEFVRQRRDTLELAAYFVIMVMLTPRLTQLFSRGWYSQGPGHITRSFLTTLANAGIGLGVLQAFTLGSACGLMALMVFDRLKRPQGILLWVGLISLTIAFYIGGFTPRIFRNLTAWSRPLIVGIVTAVAVATPMTVWQSLSSFEIPETLEFRRAPALLNLLVSILIVAMWVEAHFRYPELIFTPQTIKIASEQAVFRFVPEHALVDAFVGLAFIVSTRKFMQYEAQTSVMIIGKTGAGKTVLAQGIYRTLFDDPAYNTPSTDSDRLEELATARGTTEDDKWWADNTQSAGAIDFTVTVGRIFPKHLTFDCLDYPGENFQNLVEFLDQEPTKRSIRDGLSATETTGKSIEREDLSTTTKRMLEQFEQADTILLAVDVADIVADDRKPDFSGYLTILQAASETKHVKVVATKSDHLADEYQTERGREVYNSGNIDDFAEYVTDRLQRTQPVIDVILAEANADQLYPTYWWPTELDDTGKRIPTSNARPYGCDYLFDAIIQR